MYKYQAFDRLIKSEVTLPYLIDFNPDNKLLDEINIYYGKINSKGIQNPIISMPFFQANTSQCWIHVPHIAFFLISKDSKIVIDACSGTDENSIQAFLLTNCFKILLSQLGLNVFNGSAVNILNKAVVFIARSGFGKSTLSQLFIKNSYNILTEETCVIDSSFNLLPSFPQLCLWKNIASQLKIDITNSKKVRENINKFAFKINENFCAKKLPVNLIYILDYHKKDEIVFQSISENEFWKIQQSYMYDNLLYNTVNKKSIDLKHIKIIKLSCPRWNYTMDEIGYLLTNIFPNILNDIYQRDF